MTDPRRDDGSRDGACNDSTQRDDSTDGGCSNDALPAETLAALRAAWGKLPAPSATRELAAEDEATRRAVGWLVGAWRSPEVLAPRNATARHAPLALHAAQRNLAAQVGVSSPASPASPTSRLTGWRRQVAAAALIIALLGAALLLRDVVGVAAGRPSADEPGPFVVVEPAPVPAPVPAQGPAASPAPPRAPPHASVPPALLAAGNPPPIELRAGRTRVLLFTDSTRRTQENQP